VCFARSFETSEDCYPKQEEAVDPARVRLTARLRLEPMRAEHAADLWHLFQDPAVAAWYGAWTFAMAQREAARIAEAWVADGVHKWMAYDRSTGALVGRGGLSRAHIAGRDRLEIGWALLRPFWGCGYATEIGRAGLAFAFDELAADEVVSYTEARNARSRAVMERLGLQYTTDIVLEDGGEPFALYVLGRPS
jgi:RimJ/RimL family protein N-acetyltransferase